MKRLCDVVKQLDVYMHDAELDLKCLDEFGARRNYDLVLITIEALGRPKTLESWYQSAILRLGALDR